MKGCVSVCWQDSTMIAVWNGEEFHEAWSVIIHIQDYWDLLGRGPAYLSYPSIHHINAA